VQGQLFEDVERRRGEALDQTIDAIRARLGSGAIRRGSLLDRPPPLMNVDGQVRYHGP